MFVRLASVRRLFVSVALFRAASLQIAAVVFWKERCFRFLHLMAGRECLGFVFWSDLSFFAFFYYADSRRTRCAPAAVLPRCVEGRCGAAGVCRPSCLWFKYLLTVDVEAIFLMVSLDAVLRFCFDLSTLTHSVSMPVVPEGERESSERRGSQYVLRIVLDRMWSPNAPCSWI